MTRIEPDDERLDDEQRAAVEATEKAIAVLAGPGSGKTRTLAHRARHLLESNPDSQALLLTFTNKAASEMKTRALRMGTIEAEQIEAGTFHHFGHMLLRSIHGKLVGVEPEFDILDDLESTEFAAHAASTHKVTDLSDEWGHDRLRGIRSSSGVMEFGAVYEAAKREANVVDFDDLVVYAAQILQEHPQVAELYAARFPHVLVDEFQDTNRAHFRILSALFPYVQTVSVFADDDQAIMQFAGADVANINTFVKQLKARVYPLTCNYRCRKEIVKCANLLIAADPKPSRRKMHADRDGGTVDLRPFRSEEEEVEAIADDIAERVLHADDPVPAASIAVLVRSAKRVTALVLALRRRKVPVTDWRGPVYDTADRRALRTCMSVLRPRLGGWQSSRLAEFLGVPRGDEHDTHAFLESQAGNPIADALLGLRELAFEGATPTELAEQARQAIVAKNEKVGERARSLVAAIADFEAHDATFTIDHMLSELALKSGGRPPTEGGGVKIANLHSTKGLEWPIVYMIGLEEGRLPDFRSDGDGTVGDERRTCFVGVCRAEDELVLTYSKVVSGFGQRPSRFLREMRLI